MRGVTIIDALTRMGNTENMGTLEVPYDNTIQEYMESYFGNDDSILVVDGNVKYETPYLYSYENRIWGLRGTMGADVVINVINKKEEKFQIFLYEIE